MSDRQTTLADAVARAEFAKRIAASLMMFPLLPQPGDSMEHHAQCLEISFTQEIMRMLNEEVRRHAR
jgi:hypothetical protein